MSLPTRVFLPPCCQHVCCRVFLHRVRGRRDSIAIGDRRFGGNGLQLESIKNGTFRTEPQSRSSIFSQDDRYRILSTFAIIVRSQRPIAGISDTPGMIMNQVLGCDMVNIDLPACTFRVTRQGSVVQHTVACVTSYIPVSYPGHIVLTVIRT